MRGAVDSVNKAVEMSSSKRKEPRRPALVDESLDSLDFFKVTNLGRFYNAKDQQSTTKQQSRALGAPIETRESSLPASKNQQSISTSSRKHVGGPIIRGGALPEEFMLGSPARSIPSRKSKKERDTLDDFVGL